MTRKINNSYLLGQSNAPTTGGDMLKTRSDGTPVWEEVDGTAYIPLVYYGGRGLWGGGVSSNLRLGMQGKMDASLGGSFQSPQLSLGSDQLIADKFNQPVPDFFGDRLRFGGTFRY